MRYSLSGGAVGLGALVVIGACSDGGRTSTRSSLAALPLAVQLGQTDMAIRRSLAVRDPGAGFVDEGTSDAAFSSAGWRGASQKRWHDLGARAPKRANDAVLVGLSQFPATQLSLRPRGAKAVEAVLTDGHLVYAGAYGSGADLVVTSTAASIEELFVLRDESAPSTFAWDVVLPSGIVGAKVDPTGAVLFLDRRGNAPLRVMPPYAVDAAGAKHKAKLGWDATARVLSVHLDTTKLKYPALLDPSIETTTWTELQVPSTRTGAAMAYDPAHGKVVLFGGGFASTSDAGIAVTTVLNDTWTWDGIAWTEETAPGPPARENHAMAYDAARQRVVLFGGSNPNLDVGTSIAAFNDTWLWDGAAWSQGKVQTSPPGRDEHVMSYDAARKQVVLFGGEDVDANPLGDTWLWDGARWNAGPTDLHDWTTTPSERTNAAMAFDVAHGRTVLFGGLEGGSADVSDTWAFDGKSWSLLAPPTSPDARDGAGMVWEAAKNRLLLIGGVVSLADGGPSPDAVDMWAFDGTNWTAVPASLPPDANNAFAFAYDEARARTVILGGTADEGTSIFDGATWTNPVPVSQPTPREQSAMTTDEVHHDVVLFGGLDSSNIVGAPDEAVADTWIWNGRTWSEADDGTSDSEPDPRGQHALCFDGTSSRVLLYGGGDGAGDLFGDTWAWDGTAWKHLTDSGPPERQGASMVYDAGNQKVVLFGGTGDTDNDGNPTFLSDTWLWNGTKWTQAKPATKPLARSGYGLTYDPLRHQTVLFGGMSATYDDDNNAIVQPYGDTWTWDGASWTKQAPAASPPAQSDVRLTFDTTTNLVVLFGGDPGGFLNDTWTWDGATWTKATGVTAPAARSFHALARDPVLGGAILFGGADATGSVIGDTWHYFTVGGGCTSGSECDTGSCVDGVCCATASCGTCATCAGSAPGSCTPIVNSPDPDSCAAGKTCDGAGSCAPANGQMCTNASQCASGFCASGVCCDSACTGGCQSCTAAGKGSGADGVCGNTKVGGAPDATGDGGKACPRDDARTCGRDGTCDGEGGCHLYKLTTPCGNDICEGDSVVGPICDGQGACMANSGGKSCAPYGCNVATATCADGCHSNADCLVGTTCIGGKCVTSQAGSSCDGAHTLTVPDGSTKDCFPYNCSGSVCLLTCRSIEDCVAGYVCDGNGECSKPQATNVPTACSYRPTPNASDGDGNGNTLAGGGLLVVAAMVARRRKKRRTRHRQ